MFDQIKPMWDFFVTSKKKQIPLVLATIVKTTGSSYKKKGSMMLIKPNKESCGLLSGGCLENDIIEHSMTVIDTQKPMMINYDLNDDSIFGLGAGCNGRIYILLQLLNDNYMPFSALNPHPDMAQNTQIYINIKEDTIYPLGAYSIIKGKNLCESHSRFTHFAIKNKIPLLAFYKPPKVAIFGAGHDTLAVVKCLHFIHWQGMSIDYRKGLLIHENFPTSWQLCLFKKSQLRQVFDNSKFDAIVIMSHNIINDTECLQLAHEYNISYIGLLGSKHRRDKILKLAKLDYDSIKGALKAPIGFSHSGRLPENIAISIVAELQREFSQS